MDLLTKDAEMKTDEVPYGILTPAAASAAVVSFFSVLSNSDRRGA